MLKNGNIPHVAIVDLNLPSYPDQNLYSGIDCSILIKEYAPHCKIIFITAHEEALTLYQIYRKSNPNALIVKSDFVQKDIENLLKGNLQEPYLSIKSEKALNDVKLKASLLSSRNAEILMYLSKGFKVSQIGQLIDLSNGAVQKRLNKMLQEFKVTNYHELIQVCKVKNLI